MAVCGRCDCKNVLYMRKIDDIIIHCTATAEGRDVSVADIRRWHKARGFVDVGYHYVVYLDGSVHEGRPLAQVGAHCRGHNAHSVGVCYVGGLAADGHAQGYADCAATCGAGGAGAAAEAEFSRGGGAWA